ncbi:beta-glucanase precursor [Haloferula sp.]|uniref:beta-glucanase precursor n=1 Tax=Haloferula sp. TaxID=2497595 RepID=UPI003C742066
MRFLIHLLITIAAFSPVRGNPLDFGDHSSATLTTKAWDAFNAERHGDAIGYANKCVELYHAEAIKMQQELKAAIPSDKQEEVSKKWALNDVGTCLFILGQALEKQDKNKEALAAYLKMVDTVSFAQTWDTNGWFWKPADAAKTRIKALEFEALD